MIIQDFSVPFDNRVQEIVVLFRLLSFSVIFHYFHFVFVLEILLFVSVLKVVLCSSTSGNWPLVVRCVISIAGMSALLRGWRIVLIGVVLLRSVLNLLVSWTTQVYSNVLLLESCLPHWVYSTKVPCFFIIVIGIEELVLSLLLLRVEVLLLYGAVVWSDMSLLVSLFVPLCNIIVLLSSLGCYSKFFGFSVRFLPFSPCNALLWCFVVGYWHLDFNLRWRLLLLMNYSRDLLVVYRLAPLQSLAFWFHKLNHLFLNDIHLQDVGYWGSIIWLFLE